MRVLRLYHVPRREMPCAALASALVLLVSTGLGFAQAPAPIGYWTTADNGERLLVQQNGQCSFQSVQGTFVGGSCTWKSTSRGGILTIYYSTVRGPAPVYYNVVWINQTTISVWGDIFYRRQ